MKFNLQASVYEERFRRYVAPRLMMRHWLGYQLMRTLLAYLPAYRRSDSRKPFWQTAVEMLIIAVRWRCLPFHYLRYGLYEREHRLREVLGYLPETVLYYRLLPAINRDVVLLDDKLTCKQILSAGEAAQPVLLAYGDAHTCHAATGWDRTHDHLDTLLRDWQSVVVKPARYSSGGDGVLPLIHKAGKLYDERGEVVSLKDFGATWGSWLLEEFVQQHTELATLNERSLNTFRVITTYAPAHGARVEYCVLKLGAGDGLADNAHGGGLYVRVDTVSGALDEVAFDETFTRHRRHPAGIGAFSGRRVSMIDEVVGLARQCAALFPRTRLVGWDIAVGTDGPLVIEGNSSPGLTNIQRTHGGVARTLGRTLTAAREGQHT